MAEDLHLWISHARPPSPRSSTILDCRQQRIHQHHPYLSLLSFFEVVVITAPYPSFAGPMAGSSGTPS
ncbi:hypothetical protein E2562_026148 [Oryza meyeriana var. granulata]|uniref:Uncharacterized protein n=1 Tax=Oryza meyeriana var. granulata TaxID=110450 RepID=A0A6G1FCS9_9ORYZ|nr:hypothetical protein E2562_026148 [Oryza meyeriana var. granulata]